MRSIPLASLFGLLSGLLLVGWATGGVRSAPVEGRGGIPATVTAEQAVAAVVEWGDWLGIRAEECSVRPRDFGEFSAFPHHWVVTSRDGRHEFMVNGYTGHVSSWRDTHGPSESRVPEDPTEREALASIAREFIAEHLPFLEPAVMVNDENPRLWIRAIGNDVLFDSSYARVYASLDTRSVHEVTMLRSEPRGDTSPLISPRECTERAEAFVDAIPGVEIVDRAPQLPPSFEWQTRHYVRQEDPAGAQRTTRMFFMRISREGETAVRNGVDPHHRGMVLLRVDARTGEVFRAEGMEEDPGRMRMYLNGREFLTPLFPPRARDGVAYVAANYLDSRIWRARIERPVPDQLAIEYEGSTWQFTAGAREYLVDGAAGDLTSAPLLEAEVLYLPLEAVELVTGWTGEYSETEDAVYLNSPDPEDPA
ncbi:MAG: hypothetical protein AB7Y46_04580 [Armatimonadota bacterium]